MSCVSFDVIGWQSCAFTSWNWSRGGSEEHVGFHVMTMCHWMCHTGWKWLRKGDVMCYHLLCYSSAMAKAESKNLEVWSLKGNKETMANQSQSSRHPFTTPDWHIILWQLCRHGLISKTGMRPVGKCLWNCRGGAKIMGVCMNVNASRIHLYQCLTLCLSAFNLNPI